MSQPAQDSGFTLIELLVTMALLGAMMAITVTGWSSWGRASEQTGAARELQSLMRATHQRAVTEGRAMCVQFNTSAGQYTVYRGACDDPARTQVEGPIRPGAGHVQLSAPSFPSSAAPTGATFFARGTATAGTVQVTRSGSSKVYTLSVDGLTGRVSLS